MKKKIFISSVIVIAFVYGVLVGTKKIFPFEQLKYIKDYFVVKNNLNDRSPYYYHKKSQFEFLTNSDDYKIVMIGDSITDGGLWDELLKNNLVQNRGIGGDTTDGVLDRLSSINQKIEIAFIMIGINDFSRHKSVDEVFENYKKIIENLHKKEIKIYIQSTLYVGENQPKRLNKSVELLNQKLQEYSINNNLTFIDLNKLLSPNKVLEKKFSLDEVHLNGDGYRLWCEEIKKYL
jgi:lysophospholipase L1-like esterase